MATPKITEPMEAVRDWIEYRSGLYAVPKLRHDCIYMQAVITQEKQCATQVIGYYVSQDNVKITIYGADPDDYTPGDYEYTILLADPDLFSKLARITDECVQFFETHEPIPIEKLWKNAYRDNLEEFFGGSV